jgi:hypothetical protein
VPEPVSPARIRWAVLLARIHDVLPLFQTPTLDPVEPDPVPDFDYDQSLPDDLDP